MRTKSNTFTISDQTCTVCIIIALCVWFSSALIFVTYTSNNNTSSFSKDLFNSIPSMNQFQYSNTKQPNNTPQNKLSQSYFESISPELSPTGWKPVYLHTLNIRMPIEQMDYLLETYWYPHIPKLSFPTSTTTKQTQTEYKPTKIINNNHHKGIADIDFSILRKAKKQNKKPKIIDKQKPKIITNHKPNNMNIQPTSNNKYPSDWSMSCYPTQINNQQCIFNHMEYWSKSVSKIKSKAVINNKYVTFVKDCGGFNNIRQGFEYHVMIAWITNRTLVLPPDTPWYLIDRGGLTRGKDGLYETNQISWPNNEQRLDHTSNFDIWFDLNDMSLVIPVITAAEFIKREYDNLNIPHKYYAGDIVNKDVNVGQTFSRWLTEKANELNCNLPWGQLENVLYWPNEEQVKNKNNKIDSMWIDHRKSKTYTEHLKQQPFIHFPACKKGLTGGADGDYRYLGQIARSIAFDDIEMDKKYKQILRDHIHLNSDIMEYASMVISILGAFEYSSLHIRRNELQYKYVWCSAEDSYTNIKPLISKNEVLYIATDETKSDFFNVFQENGHRKVYQWKDFFGQEAKFQETKHIKIPGKLIGEIEMAICAMGRIFFGTKESTFSSYIGRLRGYFNAPYTQVLYHHYQLTQDIDESSDISKSKPGKPYAGKIYKMAFKDLWEDIKEL